MHGLLISNAVPTLFIDIAKWSAMCINKSVVEVAIELTGKCHVLSHSSGSLDATWCWRTESSRLWSHLWRAFSSACDVIIVRLVASLVGWLVVRIMWEVILEWLLIAAAAAARFVADWRSCYHVTAALGDLHRRIMYQQTTFKLSCSSILAHRIRAWSSSVVLHLLGCLIFNLIIIIIRIVPQIMT